MMRDQIADICDAEIQSDNPSCYTLADAIIAALPGMVKPLEWSADEIPIAMQFPYQIWANNGGSGAPDDPFIKFSNYCVFGPFLMHIIGPKGDGTDQFETLKDAKAAAQTDYIRLITSALGVEGDG